MTIDETKALIEMLRANGVSSYKTKELKLTFGAEVVKVKAQPKEITPADLTEDQKKDIEHKIEEMKSVMGLDDEDLLNRLYPEGDAEDTATAG